MMTIRTDRFRWLRTGLVGLGVAGCRSVPSFLPVANVRELMATVIEPAADLYWDAVGTVDDSTGSTSFAPETAEEWATVRNNAMIVAESGNLLMMDPRARDRDQWMVLSRAMVEAGKQAVAAANAQDTAAVFNAGAALYESCSRCHAVYLVKVTPPKTQGK